MNRIFSRKLTRARDCPKYFFEVLASASMLYRDSLMIRRLDAQIYKNDTRPRNRPIVPYVYEPRAGKSQEAVMRPRFRKRIESLPCWAQFQPENEFEKENRLRTLEDYTSTLALHLPEIYGETFNMEECLGRFRFKKDFSAVAKLIVGLAHIAHHVSYCHYALEILSDEWRWR